MSLFVVMAFYARDEWIIGIFSTQEKAEQCVRRADELRKDPRITEYRIDELQCDPPESDWPND